MAQLVLAEQEQHRRRDGPGAPDRVVADADLGAVGHADDHALAGRQGGPLAQAAGQPPGPVGQLRARPLLVLEVQP
jgi:hypothetical protein